MTDRAALRLARALFALITLLLIGGLAAATVLMVEGPATLSDLGGTLILPLGMYSFALVGYVIARKAPRHAIAWILLGVGLAWQVHTVASTYAEWGFTHPGRAPQAAYAAAWASWLWIPGLGPLGTFLLLLFPDGHLPTPRWRWWAWLSGGAMVLASLGILFGPGPIDGESPDLLNPLGIEALRPVMFLVISSILAIPVCIVGCAVALIRRYRASRGTERLQLKWLASASAFVAVVYLASVLLSLPFDWATDRTPRAVLILQNVSLAAFVLIPVAVGVAILRHRLYDIDRIINRALVYAAATGLLALVYAGGVVGSQALLRGITGRAQNNLSVAASTLAVAALFGPVRTRVQAFVDRRFYRGKYDAARTVEAFSAHLRQETDLDALTDQLRGVIAQTVQPTGVTLWIAKAAPGAPARP